MILQGNEDLRVVKTIEGVKRAFEEVICEKDYEKITVKELCDRVRLNKKTFYHYYETLKRKNGNEYGWGNCRYI